MVWQLVGTPTQNAIIQRTLDRCDFPFDRLIPGLRARTGRDTIPVEWADLSRWASAAAAEDHDDHDHGDDVLKHFHVEEDGDIGHGVMFRNRVLGLAWYSGKISIEQTLESNPDLAGEVWISEGAHMVDFFYMTDEHRIAVWNSVHPPEQHIPAGTNIEDGVDLSHGHGWFDMASYREWVGEELMGLFVKSFSDFPLTIDFAHTWDIDAIQQVRYALVPEFAPQPDPVPPTEPEDAPFYGKANSKVYHDRHKSIHAEVLFASVTEAVAAGRRACRVCKPGQ